MAIGVGCVAGAGRGGRKFAGRIRFGLEGTLIDWGWDAVGRSGWVAATWSWWESVCVGLDTVLFFITAILRGKTYALPSSSSESEMTTVERGVDTGLPAEVDSALSLLSLDDDEIDYVAIYMSSREHCEWSTTMLTMTDAGGGGSRLVLCFAFIW